MWTTFDRYLFSRYAYVMAVFFFASMGMYAVVDGFSEFDYFQKTEYGIVGILSSMAYYYLNESVIIFDLLGPSLSVISVLVVLALLLKNNEFYPLLSAGVPTYRIARPFVLGVGLVGLVLAANQQFVIPYAAQNLAGSNESHADTAASFDPQYDVRTSVFVAGKHLSESQKKIFSPLFVLPAPEIVSEYEPELRGEYAVYVPASGNRKAGWLLKNPSAPFDFSKLTPAGRKIVQRTRNGKDIFLSLGLTFDQLRNRGTGFRYLSTSDLIHRIQYPNAHASSTRAQIMHLHTRFTRPLVSLMSVFLVIPLIIRKERDNLIANISICTLTLAAVLGIAQGMEFLGQTSLIQPEVAAWSPILFGGTMAGWLSGSVKT